MSEITDERINQLRSSIHKLRVFLNYSNSMKKRSDEDNQKKINSKKFNEDKISQLESKEQSGKMAVKKKNEKNNSIQQNQKNPVVTGLLSANDTGVWMLLPHRCAEAQINQPR